MLRLALPLFIILPLLVTSAPPVAPTPISKIPRCEATPLGNGTVLLTIDGVEIARWNSGAAGEGGKAHLFPVKTPSGALLTRMGHPGAPNHDHHRSIWFGHHDVGGVDFWSEGKGTSVRQKEWLAYLDGEELSGIAVLLEWADPEGKALMEHELVVTVAPAPEGGAFLEIQSRLRPTTPDLALGKTNFGPLGIRLAKSISAYFGGGTITDSEGRLGEEAIFGQRARWVDYSGPVATGEGESRRAGEGGITWFDHPENPRYPSHWHVREDGWMGASFCFADPYQFEVDQRLVLRYLLHLHDGGYREKTAQDAAKIFASSRPFIVEKSTAKHTDCRIRREGP